MKTSQLYTLIGFISLIASFFTDDFLTRIILIFNGIMMVFFSLFVFTELERKLQKLDRHIEHSRFMMIDSQLSEIIKLLGYKNKKRKR